MKKIVIAITLAALMVGNADARSKHRQKRSKTPAAVPAFSTKSFLVADMDGHILKEQDGDTVRPIASISKLMIAMLATEQDLDEQLAVPVKRTVQSSIPRKVATLTRKELLTLALVRSDNFATQILCENITNCVDKLNERARDIGMLDTHYTEPTGLSRENVSTAQDLLKLMIVASTNDVIRQLSSMPSAEIPIGKQSIKVHNTNPLTSRLHIVLSKTGYTNPAGGCLVMIMDSAVGQRILILLGSKNARTRVPDMEKLVKEL